MNWARVAFPGNVCSNSSEVSEVSDAGVDDDAGGDYVIMVMDIIMMMTTILRIMTMMIKLR